MDDIADLLETAAAAMRADLMGALPADRRYTAAMVANAMAIAARALRHPAPRPGDDRALAAAIRAGQHDSDPDLLAALRARVNARLAVSDPAALETP